MARGKNPFILILALGSGVLAFMLSLQVMKPKASAPAAPKASYTVVVAVRDINIGAIIKKDDVDLLPPSGDVNSKQIFEHTGDVIGKVVRRNVPKGDVVKKVDILSEGDNLASLIPKGYRAVTIPVTLPGSITALLQIGNRVDVLLTYEVSRGEINSVTLIENARVIGVSNPQAASGGGDGNKRMDITLSVTPEGAQTLAYAMKRGTLNVSIRSLDEGDDEKFFTLKDLFFPKEDTVSEVIKPMNDVEKPKVPRNVVEIIRGVNKEQYATDWE